MTLHFYEHPAHIPPGLAQVFSFFTKMGNTQPSFNRSALPAPTALYRTPMVGHHGSVPTQVFQATAVITDRSRKVSFAAAPRVDVHAAWSVN